MYSADQVFRCAIRFKDGSKSCAEVSKVDSIDECREFLMSQQGAASALVLVPKAAEVHYMEPQTA